MNRHLAILLVAVMAVGCRQATTADTVESGDDEAAVATSCEVPQAEVLIEEVPAEVEPVKVQPRRDAAAAKPKATGKAETIYVETEGAQGRVWGHVTMRGDSGTGTIHDWDENTWAVNVTRHGDELFAVDQNSRLYVFKLKK